MNKSALSESDICDKFIRPAMEHAGRLCADLRQRFVASQATQSRLAEALVDQVA